jgi:hypothetical protein
MRFLTQSDDSKDDIKEPVRDMLETFSLADAGALKPGANLPIDPARRGRVAPGFRGL